jgi:hypothetical protein
MQADGKVVAAIGTAVAMCLADEEAAERAERLREVRPVASPWSQTGRQELMRNRQMWQLRIVPR